MPDFDFHPKRVIRQLELASEDEEELAGLIKALRAVITDDDYNRLIKRILRVEKPNIFRLLLTHKNRSVTTNRHHLLPAGAVGQDDHTSEIVSSNTNNNVHSVCSSSSGRSSRLEDPLYRSLFKILFREGNYDPRTRNLDRRPAQIITEEMRQEILEDAGMMDDMVAPKRLSSYIQSFTRRLSNISRPHGRKTEPTTFFEEYCKIYRTEDVLGVRRITEQYENENLDSNNNPCSKPRRKRKSMRYSIPDNSAPISVKTASIKSSRGRKVKSARLSDYAY